MMRWWQTKLLGKNIYVIGVFYCFYNDAIVEINNGARFKISLKVKQVANFNLILQSLGLYINKQHEKTIIICSLIFI